MSGALLLPAYTPSRPSARPLAAAAALYTLAVALLVSMLCGWRLAVNATHHAALRDVYYGVQTAYLAILGGQAAVGLLSALLLWAIHKEGPPRLLQERASLAVPWTVVIISVMALEAVATVYCNVLRDHVNRRFDALSRAEAAGFLARAVLNVAAIYGVLRFYNLVRSGYWKRPDAYEL